MFLKKALITGLLTTPAFLFAGCATSFSGHPHLDRPACEAKCKSWGMDLDGMVAMGEYSDACVCKKLPRHGADVLRDSEEPGLESSAAAAGGAVGVILQTRASEAAAARTNAMLH
jgi:hypothetical protein